MIIGETCHSVFWRRMTGQWFGWCWKHRKATVNCNNKKKARKLISCCKG